VEVGGGREVELGYALLDKYWGMGFAMEMAREILKLGFDRFQLKSIVALIDADNIRSRRVAEKLGFHFERHVTWKGLPAMLYRLQSQDWIRR
jgi:[ribosomal protein S5]-alanine N-acetyltransferase